MKKLCCIVLVVACATAGFCVDMSIGGGFGYAHAWSSGNISAYNNSVYIAAKSNFIDIKGFFDAQYLLVEVGSMVSIGNTNVSMTSVINGGYTSVSEKLPLRTSNVHIGLFGKYPFVFGIVKIYPIVGFEFDFNVYAKMNGQDLRSSMTEEQKKDTNSYYFSFGGGTDILITKNIFIRPLLLFGVQMNKGSEYKKLKKLALSDVHVSSNSFKVSTGLSIGYTF